MTERARQTAALPRRRAGRRACLVAAVACLATPSAVAGEVAVEVHARTVSLVARDTAIRDVIDALADAGALVVEAGCAPERRVDVSYRGLPVDAIVRRLLRGESYELITRDGRPPALRLPDAAAIPSAPEYSNPADALLAALSSADAEVRLEAVLAIGDSGEQAFARYVAPYRYDPAPGVRMAAAAVLEVLGGEAGSRTE